MKHNHTFLSLLMFFIMLIVVSGCGNSKPTYDRPEISNAKLIGDSFTTYTKQYERTNNCDGAMPIYTISRSLENENTTFFNIETEAGSIVKGTPIPEFLTVELEAKIKAALGNSISDTYSQEKQIPVNTDKGHFLEHEITWKETRVTGVVEAIFPDGVAKLGFEKIIGIELFDRTSRELGCGVTSNHASSLAPTTPVTIEETAPAEITSFPSPTVEINSSENNILREHKKTPKLGNGVLEYGFYSDGMAPIAYDELMQKYSKIQRIRLEENPDGCGIAFYDSDQVWIGASSGMKISINDEIIGTMLGTTGSYGFLFEFSIKRGDKICMSPVTPGGFHIIFGPDVIYHFDSYCYRGNC